MSWPSTRIRFVADLNPSVPTWVTTKPDLELSFLPMEAIGEDGTLSLDQLRNVEAVRQGYSFFEDGDVAFAKVTPCFENGKAAVLEGLVGGAGFGTTEVTVARPRPEITKRFLFYVLTEARFRQFGQSEMTGAGGLKRVPDLFTKNFRFPLPSLPEQQQIAEFLDRETAQIDELIAKQERLIELLAEKRQAVITSSLDLPIVEAAEVSQHTSQPHQVRQTLALKFACEITTGYAFPSDIYVPDGVPIIRISDIGFRGLTDMTECKFVEPSFADTHSKYLVHNGDLVMAMTGATVGKVGRYEGKVPALLNQRVCKLHPRKGVLRADYLGYVLSSAKYQEHIRLTAFGGAQPNISDKELVDFTVSIPSIQQQQEISHTLQQRLRILDTLVGRSRSSLRLLKERRSALISAAVTGKINVQEGA